jgi:hypothetical protein
MTDAPPSEGRAALVRAVLRPAPPGLVAGWWPVVAAIVLLVGVVALAPSRPGDTSLAAEGGPGRTSEVGADAEPSGDRVDGSAPTVPGRAGGAASGPGPGSGDVDAGGDRSHCTPDGRQHGITFHAPPCTPAFQGGNGGATATGVTGSTVRVVGFFLRCEALTESLLRGLGFELATCAQQEAMMQAAVRHLNRRLELYGRRIAYEVHWADCPFPEDLDTCLADARAVIATRPFAVVTSFAGTYQAVWEEIVRNGIVLVGGGALSDSAYERFDPYWWSPEMSSTLQARIVADWWCSTMAGRPADHTGRVVHPSIGKRGEVVRRAGLLYYDAPAGREAARILTDALAACGTRLTSFGYSADLATLQQQALAMTSRFISDKVTTLLWFDYLAPTFVAPELTRQGYFPEHVAAGGSGSSADSSHRSIDTRQWRHSISLFPEPNAVPRERSEAAAVLRDGAFQGPIPPSPEAYTRGLLLLGHLIQAAGPDLTPANLRAVESQPRRGGDGSGDASGPREGIGFGPRDHNGVDDVREVWFDPSAISPLDGQRGTLRNTDGGARRRVGSRWAGPGAVPVAAE